MSYYILDEAEPLPTDETFPPPWECTKDDEPAPGGCFEGVNMDCCSARCSNSGEQLCKNEPFMETSEPLPTETTD